MVGRDRLIRHNGDYAMASDVLDENIKRYKDKFVFMGEISDRTRLFSIVQNAICCILPTRIDNLPKQFLNEDDINEIKLCINEDKSGWKEFL